MSFPPPIESLTLRVTTGLYSDVQSFVQTISSANMGSNSIPIHNTSLTSAFNNQPPGTIFNASIVTTYSEFPSGDTLSTHGVLNFVPRKITPTLSLGGIPTPITSTGEPFSLTVTSPSDGAKSYSSSNPGVATVNSLGLVTPVAAGTTTITVNQSASEDEVYTAASVTQPLVVSPPVVQTAPVGFSVLTDDSDFSGLDFDSGMTTLFTNEDEAIRGITMPNSNFTFNGAAYTILYASSNGWFSFGTSVAEVNFGNNAQQPINTFRYFGRDNVSTGSCKFVSNNTRLLFKLTGYIFNDPTKSFTIKVIITQSGEIRINYTLASTITSDPVTIGFVGGNSSATSDDTLLTLDGVTFNRSTLSNLFSLLNGRTILFIK